MNGILAPDNPAMMQQGQPQETPPPQMQPQQPQQGGAVTQRIAGDKAAQQVMSAIQQQLQGNEQVIIDKLADGKGDIELEIAETAGNLAKAGADIAKAQLEEQSIENVVMAILTKLINMAVDEQLLPQEQAKKLAQRTLPMAMHVYANGPGSVE